MRSPLPVAAQSLVKESRGEALGLAPLQWKMKVQPAPEGLCVW